MTHLVRLLAGTAAAPRRLAILGLLAALPCVVGLLGQLLSDPEGRFATLLLERLLLSIVVPLVTLVISGSMLGDLREDGSIVLLATTAQSRRKIALAAALTSIAIAGALLIPLSVAAVALSGSASATLMLGVVSAAALAIVGYSFGGVWLSLISKRPLMIAVLYSLLWEGAVSSFAPSAGRLSISAYARRIIADELPRVSTVRIPDVSVTYAYVALVVIAAGLAGLMALAARDVELS